MMILSFEKPKISWKFISLLFFIVVSFTVLSGIFDPAHALDATEGGGAGLPWEGPLEKLRKSMSGPVAFVIALLGIIACGATLIWGGEVTEFTRRIIYVILVVCLIVFANTMLTGVLFTGAVLPSDAVLAMMDSLHLIKSYAAQIYQKRVIS